MNESIAQSVALTLHANAYLVKGEPFTLDLSHWTERYDGSISFFDLTGNALVRPLRETSGAMSPIEPAMDGVETVAQNPVQWVDLLTKSGVRLLRLHFVPNCDAVIKETGAGDRWFIEADRGDLSDYWEQSGQFARRSARDRGVWTNIYSRVVRDSVERLPAGSSVFAATAELRSAVEAAKGYAAQRGLCGFVATFDKALEALVAEVPAELSRCREIVPPVFKSVASRRLLGACEAAACVFGGMGSWNDMGFRDDDDRRTYESVDYNLYTKVCSGIVAAVNGLVE